jgi:hypothetical protein
VRLVLLALVGSCCAPIGLASATTTTGSWLPYSYDRATDAQVARAGIQVASARIGNPERPRQLSNARFGDFLAAEEETAALRTFQTYTKTNTETGKVYAGRTSGYGTPLENVAARDAGHVYTAEGFGPAELDQTSESYAAIRGREQQLIEYYREQGISANKINGIGPRNPNGPGYIDAATRAFGGTP